MPDNLIKVETSPVSLIIDLITIKTNIKIMSKHNKRPYSSAATAIIKSV
jgi:hypothetical protein